MSEEPIAIMELWCGWFPRRLSPPAVKEWSERKPDPLVSMRNTVPLFH